MSVKTCPDCGAPVQENMLPTAQHGCWFWNQYAEQMRREGYGEDQIEAALHSGADPSCSGNHYDYMEAERRRERGGVAIATAIMLVIAAVVIMIVWWNA